MPVVESNPLISFVVLCYRFEKYLGLCIESILSQQGDYPFEIVIIDDASPDNSLAVARSFAHPGIRVVSHKFNLGHAATVNEGMTLTRGSYIARIDGDDYYCSNFLSVVMPIFEQHPEVGLIYGDAAIVNSEGSITTDISYSHHNNCNFKGNEFIALLEKNFICAPTVIARREAWGQVLPAPLHLAFHDWYFTTMIARTWEFYYTAQITAHYRVHSGNLHSQIVLNRTEEPSIIWMLDYIFSTK